MIRTGTLLILKGIALPRTIQFEDDTASDGWTSSGSADPTHRGWISLQTTDEVSKFKEDLELEGWECIAMARARKKAWGHSSPAKLALLLEDFRGDLRRNRCNSLQIHEVQDSSLLGIPFVVVRAQYCHVQKQFGLSSLQEPVQAFN